MSRIETFSHTGQDEPPPRKEDRDAAFSSGGGRKAECELSNRSKKRAIHGDAVEPPIGLELETRADFELHKTQKDDAEGLSRHQSAQALQKDVHRAAPTEAAEKLSTYADALESRDKWQTAQKVRDVAAKIVLQEQNELDGFPIQDCNDTVSKQQPGLA